MRGPKPMARPAWFYLLLKARPKTCTVNGKQITSLTGTGRPSTPLEGIEDIYSSKYSGPVKLVTYWLGLAGTPGTGESIPTLDQPYHTHSFGSVREARQWPLDCVWTEDGRCRGDRTRGHFHVPPSPRWLRPEDITSDHDLGFWLARQEVEWESSILAVGVSGDCYCLRSPGSQFYSAPPA